MLLKLGDVQRRPWPEELVLPLVLQALSFPGGFCLAAAGSGAASGLLAKMNTNPRKPPMIIARANSFSFPAAPQ
jgi:hypothetical protein